MAKNAPTNTGDAGNPGLIPGSGRSLRVGNGDPLQFPCLENSMVRGVWWVSVHGVAKSQPQLSSHTHIYRLRWVPIHYDQCPYRKGKIQKQKHTQVEHCVKKAEIESMQQKPRNTKGCRATARN